jgi:hypothetical protein
LHISGHGVVEPNGFSHVMSGLDIEHFLSAPRSLWPADSSTHSVGAREPFAIFGASARHRGGTIQRRTG